MFTFGWIEIFLIVIIIVVVIGPKDLPKFVKQITNFTKSIKKISNEFKTSLNDMAEETELKEISKSIKEVKKIKDGINIKKNFENEINTVKETIDLAENEIKNKEK